MTESFKSEAIQDKTEDSLKRKVTEPLNQLSTTDRVSLQQIPAGCGITGNEEADKLAKDMEDILNKSSNLKDDGTRESLTLRSRIDEQCQLIMILKQKADEEATKVQVLDRMNKQLIEFQDQAQTMLQDQQQTNSLLEARFHTLASNHEEMIRIKDDYKHQNEDLRLENLRLKQENTRLSSQTFQDNQNLIDELQIKCQALTESYSSLEDKFRLKESQWQLAETELHKQITEIKEDYSQQIQSYCERLQKAEAVQTETERRLQAEQDRNFHSDEMANKFSKLSQENAELLAQHLHKDSLLKEQIVNNELLRKKIQQLEKSLTEQQNKFVQQMEAVNTNEKVRSLSQKLQDSDNKCLQTIKDFEAFKKHSGELLQRERELNSKLRQLYSP